MLTSEMGVSKFYSHFVPVFSGKLEWTQTRDFPSRHSPVYPETEGYVWKNAMQKGKSPEWRNPWAIWSTQTISYFHRSEFSPVLAQDTFTCKRGGIRCLSVKPYHCNWYNSWIHLGKAYECIYTRGKLFFLSVHLSSLKLLPQILLLNPP